MASTVSSIDASIGKLATTYQKVIKSIIDSESAPLIRTQTLRDQLDIRRGVFSDIKTNFDALQSAVQALISTQASYGLNLVSKASITPTTAGTTVLTSTTTSESAAVADYDFLVSKLAKAESRAMAAVSSPDVALNKSGTFWLGGTGAAALQTETAPGVYSDFVPSTTVLSATTGPVATGQRELGEGSYTIQVRDLSGVRQFRMVDADGTPVFIKNTDGTSSYTTNWQNTVNGSYDSGRGQSLTLNGQGSLDVTTFHYTAKGVSVLISASDTLRTIAKAINSVSQPDGHDLKASIVANQLVLTAAQTGKNHTMNFKDEAGLGFATLLQQALNAEFFINGMRVSTASNTNLTNIVDGATIHLAADAESKSARLSVGATTDKAAGLVSIMVSKFNTAMSHLKDKLASAAKTEGDKTTYTRGPLTGDTTFSSLRTDLLYRMGRSVTNSGTYKRLDDIGLSFDKDMKLTLDSSKFSDALKSHSSDVAALLDAAMGGLNDTLSKYTGSKGVISTSLSSMDNQRKSYDQRIDRYSASITMRKEALYKQYMDYQTQLAQLGNTATMFGIDLGSAVDTSS